jgi:hypothetical protein
MATQPVAIFDLDGPVNTSAPLTGHDHIRVVAPAMRTDEPLTPIGNGRLEAVSSHHFGGDRHCATFGGTM